MKIYLVLVFTCYSFVSFSQDTLPGLALDTNRQYNTLMNRYKNGDRSKDRILRFVPLAISQKDFTMAYEGHNLFFDQVHNPFIKDTLSVICNSISKSDDKGFQFLLQNYNKINSILESEEDSSNYLAIGDLEKSD